MKEAEQAKKLAKAAPSLSAKELAEINDKYTAYIFRDRKRREVWTTCCGCHEIIPKQEHTDAQHAVMVAEHQGEEKQFSHYCNAAYVPPRKQRESTPCPFCGKDAYVKELGRTGKRDNLAAYKRIVVFRWYKGALWALAYYTSKLYGNADMLTAQPNWDLHRVYRFKPWEALCANSGYGEFRSMNKLTERPKKLPFSFYEPFSDNSSEGSGYTIISGDEINKSPFRYCRHDDFFKHSSSYMRFLAVCCIYPSQVEMLMKAGMWEAVKDLVEGRKWNAAAFKWDEPNPLASFQLNKNEMKKYLASDKSLEALVYYKQFRRQKIKCEIAEIEEAARKAPYTKTQEIMKRLKAHKIEPGRWNSYMAKETAAVIKNEKRNLTATRNLSLGQLWIDYIDAAEALGYDLTNPLMQMPKGIRKKHDAAVVAAAPVITARRAEFLSEKEKERSKQAATRYAFALDQYIIRAPVDVGEIVAEGKILKHCVGGYAERHMKSKLTILFLRSAAEPHMPLVTIEMNGDNLVQIHGLKNDKNSKIKPREKYAVILDPWLEWVQAGSKRDDNGNPVPVRKRRIRQRDNIKPIQE